MNRSTRAFVLALATLAASSAPLDARADAGTARALFEAGKELRDAGKYEDAAAKFLASYKLDPKPGTILSLADCYEHLGKTASAWSRYAEAATIAQRANQPEREQYAREHAKALEASLSKLVVDAASAPPGAEVVLDGTALDPAAWGTAVPVDPGAHSVEASAKGKLPWSTKVDVAASGARVTVTIPALADAPVTTNDAARPLESRGGGVRTAGFVLGGAGVVGVALGAGFGLVASSTWSDVKSACPKLPACDQAHANEKNDAASAATIATVGFVAGGVALAAGVVMILAGGKKPAPASSARWTLVPGPGAIGLGAARRF